MTPCRTEKVDFSKKNKKQKNKNTNRITKKTNRQEESPEETKKTRKKNKTCIFGSFCVCFFSVFFLFFPWFWFSSLFFLFALVLFLFIIFVKPYSLCCWTHKSKTQQFPIISCHRNIQKLHHMELLKSVQPIAWSLYSPPAPATGTRVTSTSAAPDMHIRLLHWQNTYEHVKEDLSDGKQFEEDH